MLTTNQKFVHFVRGCHAPRSPPTPSASMRSPTNLGNLIRTPAMPKVAEPWSLTSLREKLIKIGAKVVSHGRYVAFQLAEVACHDRCSRKSCR
jgi:hypothetical protein